MSNSTTSTATYPPLKAAFDYGQLEASVAEEAKTTAARINARRTEAIIETGRDLARIKQQLGRGHFIQWIDAEFSMSRRTAQNMMRAAAMFEDKSATVAFSPPSTLYDLAAPSTPAHVREELLERLEAGEKPHPKTIEEMVSMAKQERRQQKESQRLSTVRIDGAEPAQTAADIIVQELGEKLSHLLQVLGEHASITRADLVAAEKRAAKAKQLGNTGPSPVSRSQNRET